LNKSLQSTSNKKKITLIKTPTLPKEENYTSNKKSPLNVVPISTQMKLMRLEKMNKGKPTMEEIKRQKLE
jgi:hypothetical protein